MTSEITALEDRRYQAMIDVDVDALHELLADELVHHHSSGGADGKASFIEGLRTGKWDYQHVERVTERIDVFGDMARVTGHVRLTLGAGQGTIRIANNRYLCVWIKRVGKWQLIAWQATPTPSA